MVHLHIVGAHDENIGRVKGSLIAIAVDPMLRQKAGVNLTDSEPFGFALLAAIFVTYWDEGNPGRPQCGIGTRAEDE
jgi:hypothetical protein